MKVIGRPVMRLNAAKALFPRLQDLHDFGGLFG